MTWLDLEGPANFRDLGGVPVDGGKVRARRVYRSDSLTGLSSGDLARLRDEVGLRTVIDLRSPGEADTGVSELSEHGVTIRRLPIGKRLGSIRRAGRKQVSMSEGYLTMFELSGPTLTAGLETLASSDSLPAAFHCAGGKDRAGLMAASLLSVLGASPEVITTEYALTTIRFDRVMARLRTDPQYLDVMNRVDTDSLLSLPETMTGFLSLVQTRHGSIAEFLIGHGLQEATIEALKANLIEK